MSTLADRITRAFDATRHKKADLARAANVTPASVSDWFTGNTKTLKVDSAKAAAAYLGVPAAWLAFGEGPDPFVPSAREPLKMYAEPLLTAAVPVVLRAVSQLPDYRWDQVRVLLDRLVQQPERLAELTPDIVTQLSTAPAKHRRAG